MDSNDLERERGITILAKNTSVRWKGDEDQHRRHARPRRLRRRGRADAAHGRRGAAPGRRRRGAAAADALRARASASSSASRSSSSSTRSTGRDARPTEVLNEVFDLFCDLEASESQMDFPVLYAVGKLGVAKTSLDDPSTTLVPLFDLILKHIPSANGDAAAPLQIIVNNLDHDDYTGRLAIGRVIAGTVRANQPVGILKEGAAIKGSIKVLSTFEGLKRIPTQEATAGEIVSIAGIDDIYVGDTIVDLEPGLGGPSARAHLRRAADHQDEDRRQHVAVRRQVQGVEVSDQPARARATRARDPEEPRHPARGDRHTRHLHAARPGRAPARHPRGDHAARGLRDAARQPRGRDARDRRRRVRAGRAGRHRRSGGVHRDRHRAPRRAPRSDDQDDATLGTAAPGSSTECRAAASSASAASS